MSKSSVANLAIAFMVLSAIALVGMMRASVWDPGPAGPQPMRDPRIPLFWTVASHLLLVGGAWLAGLAYAEAKVRAMLSLALGVMLASWQLLLVFPLYSH